MAREQTLTLAQWAECFKYTPETGEFNWRERPVDHFRSQRDCDGWNRRFAGKKIDTAFGKGRHVFLRVRLNGVQALVGAHTLAWAFQTGAWPNDDKVVDHENRNGRDNRWTNLRLADFDQNAQNRRAKKDGHQSRFKGVGRLKDGRWFAYVTAEKKRTYLGAFPTEEEAAAAYDQAAKRLHGEFAQLNGIDLGRHVAPPPRITKTGIRGVCKHAHNAGRWVASARGQYLGCFDNPIVAAMAVHYRKTI